MITRAQKPTDSQLSLQPNTNQKINENLSFKKF